MLAPSGPSLLDYAGAALTQAGEELLWARADDEVIARVAAALRIRKQADAVLLAAIGEVEARDLATTRGASSTRAWLTGAHQVDPARPECWSVRRGLCGQDSRRPAPPSPQATSRSRTRGW